MPVCCAFMRVQSMEQYIPSLIAEVLLVEYKLQLSRGEIGEVDLAMTLV